jgi:pyrimidine operon attenuation protein / uracil phosphoribosyltransferase
MNKLSSFPPSASNSSGEEPSIDADSQQVPRHSLLDEDTMARCISRLSYEIVERDRDLSSLRIVGIRTGGEFLGKRICARIEEIEGIKVPFGVIDITLYRDDIAASDAFPSLKGTDLPFKISGSRIVLVDDVLFTGRTIRAALDAIIDFGRPNKVELAVLIDRGHREVPIRPDYIGKNIPSHYRDSVKVKLKEAGGVDQVYLLEKSKNYLQSSHGNARFKEDAYEKKAR